MNSNTMMLLGIVTLTNPTTKQNKIFSARGFDVLGFLFPFLRYAVAGMIGKALLTFLISCTVIGFPIMCWVTAFSFRQNRVEHLLKKGWMIAADENQKKVA